MRKILIFLIAFNLIVLDLAVGYYVFKKYFDPVDIFDDAPESKLNSNIRIEGCDTDCQSKISEKIENLENDVKTIENLQLEANVESDTTPSRVLQPTAAIAKSKYVTYIPIPGSGSSTNTDWVDISGTDFYVSKSDFQGLVGVYFEANFHSQNGSGVGYLRIFDKTHSIAPSGGEISTTSQLSNFVSSGQVYLWEGNNHYVVQVKSGASDNTIFESGRLKIITEK